MCVPQDRRSIEPDQLQAFHRPSVMTNNGGLRPTSIKPYCTPPAKTLARGVNLRLAYRCEILRGPLRRRRCADDIVRRNHHDLLIPCEVGGVERKQSIDAVDDHRSDETRIVASFALDLMLNDQSLPKM